MESIRSFDAEAQGAGSCSITIRSSFQTIAENNISRRTSPIMNLAIRTTWCGKSSSISAQYVDNSTSVGLDSFDVATVLSIINRATESVVDRRIDNRERRDALSHPTARILDQISDSLCIPLQDSKDY